MLENHCKIITIHTLDGSCQTSIETLEKCPKLLEKVDSKMDSISNFLQ